MSLDRAEHGQGPVDKLLGYHPDFEVVEIEPEAGACRLSVEDLTELVGSYPEGEMAPVVLAWAVARKKPEGPFSHTGNLAAIGRVSEIDPKIGNVTLIQDREPGKTLPVSSVVPIIPMADQLKAFAFYLL